MKENLSFSKKDILDYRLKSFKNIGNYKENSSFTAGRNGCCSRINIFEQENGRQKEK